MGRAKRSRHGRCSLRCSGSRAPRIARTARDLDRRLAGCDRFLAHCPAGGTTCTLARASPATRRGSLAQLADEARGGASWLLANADGEQRFAVWGYQEGGARLARPRARADRRRGTAPAWEVLLPGRARGGGAGAHRQTGR